MASGDPGKPSEYPRLIQRGGRGRPPLITGQEQSGWTDLYQFMLSAPWWKFLLGMAAVYVAVNAAFASLYLLQPGDIANARVGSFWDAFFFSVQTIGTLGYGVMAPRTFYANVLVTAETYFGILNIAIATGAVFARFSRPTARVLFSRYAVVAPFDGTPTLMFRVANQRGNQIMEAEITVTLARQVVTQEGHVMRRFIELPLVRARTPLFALSWTVMHTIDERSPLYGATTQSLAEDHTELIIVLSGTDETFSDKIYARHSYIPDEIHWNRKFADIITIGADGRRMVDLGRFHAVE